MPESKIVTRVGHEVLISAKAGSVRKELRNVDRDDFSGSLFSKVDTDGDGKISGKDFKMMRKARVGKMIDDTEELGRVDAEKAYTKKGKKNLKAEKKRLVKEIKKERKARKGKMLKANMGAMVNKPSTRGFGAARKPAMRHSTDNACGPRPTPLASRSPPHTICSLHTSRTEKERLKKS